MSMDTSSSERKQRYKILLENLQKSEAPNFRFKLNQFQTKTNLFTLLIYRSRVDK